MAKKKQYTFADEAKALQKKFPRRETDPIEKEDYKRSMMKLMQEQEIARQEMGLTEPQGEFKSGGKMKYPYGSILPSEFATRSAVALGPALRGQNLQMPLADLTGIEPGVTEVTVPGDRNAAVRRKYSQTGYTPGMGIDKPSSLVSTPEQEFLHNPPIQQIVKKVQPDFNTLPWSYGSTPPQQQYLTPSQLSQMGQPWERPTSPINSSVTGNPGQPTQVPVKPQTAVTRDPMLTNTTRMESIGTPKIGNPIAGNPQSLTVEDSGVGTNALSGDKKGFFAENKDMLPYAISGLSNIASNLILANQAGKNIPKITPTIGSPEKINLEPQADMLRSQAGVAKNIAIRNARNLGVNPMEALAGIGAASAGIDRGLGQNLTNLYMGQEQANVGAANQFAMANQQSRERANIFNTQAKNQAKQDQLGYLGAAMSTVPGVMKDIRMDKADQQMRDVMRSYYNSMGRNYMVEGDIFDNPEDGFRYKVRNNELVRVGKNQ